MRAEPGKILRLGIVGFTAVALRKADSNVFVKIAQ
jgi:hypothetical protein